MPESRRYIFKNWFEEELGTISELTTAIDNRYSFAGSVNNFAFPFAVWSFLPSPSDVGQANSFIQERGICDFWIAAEKLTADVDAAVEAVNLHFGSRSTYVSNVRITTRHKIPIEFIKQGRVPAEQILHTGTSFSVWLA